MIGSSPRTWGTGVRSGVIAPPERFIPTHVGNRPLVRTSVCPSPVHPHARGEQCSGAGSVVAVIGSSPRTWGTENVESLHQFAIRFIPTHVGNSCSSMSASCASSVHPHARGEQRRVVDGRVVYMRFIPTHVGNRWRLVGRRMPPTVHPHARGEQVRAKRYGADKLRFIPTHVGNSCCHQIPR